MHMRLSRTAAVSLAAVGTIAAVAVVAVVADSVAASRVEADLSAVIRPETPGVRAPAVTVGGGPFGRWSGDDRLASVSVRVEGVDRPGLGPVTVEAAAADVDVPGRRTGPLTAAETTVTVLVTGDALGRALGLRDALVAAAGDPSLAGGNEHRARVTGTVDGTDTRVSAFVDLVVDDRGAHLVPVAPATGPAGVPDQDPGLALARTALTLEPDVLPLGLAVESLTVRGGTVSATGTGGPGTAPLDDLARPGH